MMQNKIIEKMAIKIAQLEYDLICTQVQLEELQEKNVEEEVVLNESGE